MKSSFKNGIVGLALLGVLAGAAPVAAGTMADDAKGIAADWLLSGMRGDGGKASIAGDKALWTDVVLQDGIGGAGMATLKADIKASDMEAALRAAGFRIMAPQKKSLAFGLRPTLGLSVFLSPRGPAKDAFYLVIASATQDCTPLGGIRQSMVTWAKVGDPLPASGDAAKDAAAIRASARACVQAFIDAAQAPSKDALQP